MIITYYLPVCKPSICDFLGEILMKTYKIHLLRHGLTAANEKGIYIGRTDWPLSPEGLARLLKMKESGVYPGAVRFFTSPLLRCRQTLEVLYPGCRQEIVPELAECNFGDWEGKAVSELKYNDAFISWVSGKLAQIPGGENVEDFQKRIKTGFEDIVKRIMSTGDTEAVVCTHGAVVMYLMAEYALPKIPMQDWAGPDGGGFTLRITPGIWMREPVAEFVAELPMKK